MTNSNSVDSREGDDVWRTQDRCGLFGWTVCIVSAALVADCRYLITENLQDSQMFVNLQVINPFHTATETLELSFQVRQPNRKISAPSQISSS